MRPGGDAASLRREAGRNIACKGKRVYGNYLFYRFFAKILADWEMSILQATTQYKVFATLVVKIVLDRWTVCSKTNVSNSCIAWHKPNISLHTQKMHVQLEGKFNEK